MLNSLRRLTQPTVSQQDEKKQRTPSRKSPSPLLQLPIPLPTGVFSIEQDRIDEAIEMSELCLSWKLGRANQGCE